MNASQFIPAYYLAQTLGVRGLIYGPPGCGKTPLLDTLKGWNPAVCVAEPAYTSMTHSSIACWPAYSVPAINEWVNWAAGSQEATQYGVKCLDSLSEVCDIVLADAKLRNKDGRAAYGVLEDTVLKWINKLYFTSGTHLICLAKEMTDDHSMKRASLPGKALNAFIPHRLDWIGHIETDYATGHNFIRNRRTNQADARERTGRLAELEPFDLDYCFRKLLEKKK